MKYNLDTECLSLEDYEDILKKQNLLPGRRLLLHHIDDNFAIFKNAGIRNVYQLRKSLSTARKIASFSEQSGISEAYLLILRREIGSFEQKPVLISSFPDADSTLIESLNKSGIKNSKDYWEQNQSATNELFYLCDLVRINGVGPVAAKAFYEAGYRSVLDISQADAAQMLEKVSAVNETRHLFKAKLGLKDMQFCIDFAQLIANQQYIEEK